MAEIQDIFAAHFEDYAAQRKLSSEQWKAARSIILCRTAALGAHVDICGHCGYQRISYNSCRNRHCPKCQSFSKERWLARQREDLLDIHYFHVVFTVPLQLNPAFLHDQRSMYDLLFRASSETVLELCADKKYLGAKPSVTAVLHTWGQNLQFHPHIHMLVTGGGLTPASGEIQKRNSSCPFGCFPLNSGANSWPFSNRNFRIQTRNSWTFAAAKSGSYTASRLLAPLKK